MSRVDNYILTSPCLTSDAFLLDLNEKLAELTNFKGNTFNAVHDKAGGPKNMEADVYLTAVNWTEESVIVEAILYALNRPGTDYDKDRFQLYVNGQEEDKFRQVTLAPQMSHGNES
jgi:hypothetical protein